MRTIAPAATSASDRSRAMLVFLTLPPMRGRQPRANETAIAAVSKGVPV